MCAHFKCESNVNEEATQECTLYSVHLLVPPNRKRLRKATGKQESKKKKHVNILAHHMVAVITAKHKSGLLRYAINVILKTSISSEYQWLVSHWHFFSQFSPLFSRKICLGFLINSIYLYTLHNSSFYSIFVHFDFI